MVQVEMSNSGSSHEIFQVMDFRCTFRREYEARLRTEVILKLMVGQVIQHVVVERASTVEALDCALREALTAFYPNIASIQLMDYQMREVHSGNELVAPIHVVVNMTDGRERWSARGESSNLVEASLNALVEGVQYGISRSDRLLEQ